MYSRINIEIEDDLIMEVMSITRSKTKKEAVNLALRQVIESNRKKELLALKGKVQWEGVLD